MPMIIKENVSLKGYNTMGISAVTRYFCQISSVDDLREVLRSEQFSAMPKLILGGGSNLLFTGDYEGLVIKIAIMGREAISETEDQVQVKIGAGENWHHWVLYAIENGWGGIENLSLIPGTVGAAPMQNIGAYGVEIKEVFESLEAVNLNSAELRTFNAEDCQFGYRNSIFKNELKNQYVITSVTLKLSKKPTINTSYGAIRATLSQMGVQSPDIKSVSEAVIHIRQSKLPDPAEIGNAGSFFKNPVIDKAHYESLKMVYPTIPGYEQHDQVKVPAAWLIEQCGWKGKTIGEIGVHKRQALVLVNYGNGKGKDLQKLAEEIQKSVADKFGIQLQTEVNIV